MKLTNHFLYMANYNRRMNQQILTLAENLSTDELSENKGAFFQSIIGTLNHILVGDIVWLTRFNLHSSHYDSLKEVLALAKPQGLADILYADLTAYRQARETVDAALINWLSHDIDEGDFNRNLVYSNTKGVRSSRNFGELVSHLFNHQTHHRGQVSTLFNQMGLDIGVTDYLVDIPDYQGV